MPQHHVYKKTDMLTATEAIKVLGCSRKTFYSYVHRGALKQYSVDGVTAPRYKMSDIEALQKRLDFTAQHSPTGVTSTDKRMEEKSVPAVVSSANTAIRTRHEHVFEKFRLALERSIPENQEILRGLVLHLGVQEGAIESFMQFLTHENDAIRFKALEEWHGIVYPRQQQTRRDGDAQWAAVVEKMDVIVNALQAGRPASAPIEAEWINAIEVPDLEEVSS